MGKVRAYPSRKRCSKRGTAVEKELSEVVSAEEVGGTIACIEELEIQHAGERTRTFLAGRMEMKHSEDFWQG
jgi:hypothetical protein